MGREPLVALRFTDNIKPREPNSPASAIENRVDADSDIGFARLCFVRQQVAYGRRRLGSYCNSHSNYNLIVHANQYLSMNSTVRLVLGIAIHCLVIYQTYVLWIKRQNAIDIS
jgi:hypothetical protein